MDLPSKHHVKEPTLEELSIINDKYKLRCTTEQLKEYNDFIKGSVQSYNFVNDAELPETDFLHRSYSKPSKEENKYNEWYIKCSLKEISSGKLHGKRIAIKDNVAIGGLPMMNGSRVLEGFVPTYDATVVKRILQEGGEIIGKTTCEDMCFSGSSFMTFYGPVRNPNNPDFSAGGSSSGSGVVVATGEADMAIGGDQGGSIRIPASSCGIVGLKPTHGLVPFTGAVSMLPCVDHLGPMTKTVADCALLLEVIASYDDGFDYRQRPFLSTEYSKFIYPFVKPTTRLKIAILQEGIDICDANVKDVFSDALNNLKENKFLDFFTISMPNHKKASHYATTVLFSGVFDAMIGGCGHGNAVSGMQFPSLVEKLQIGYKENLHELSDTMKFLFLMSDYVKTNYGSYHFAKSSSLCAHMRQEYDKILESHDVLVMPTLNNTPPRIPSANASLQDRVKDSFSMIANTSIFNITGHPALTLNCGFYEKIPIGFMIIGKHFDDTTVLNVASIVEEHLKIFIQ